MTIARTYYGNKAEAEGLAAVSPYTKMPERGTAAALLVETIERTVELKDWRVVDKFSFKTPPSEVADD